MERHHTIPRCKVLREQRKQRLWQRLLAGSTVYITRPLPTMDFFPMPAWLRRIFNASSGRD